MIKVLHTSDWHLGRKLDGYDQSEVQRRALQWIVDTVRDEHIDVVLVSGDVYDTKLPGDQQVGMLSEVLTGSRPYRKGRQAGCGRHPHPRQP